MTRPGDREWHACQAEEMTALTPEDLTYGDGELYAWPAKLGWNDNGNETSVRLYALDAGPQPRWAKPPRTIERAMVETFGEKVPACAVVIVADYQYVDELQLERCRAAAAAAVLQVLREGCAEPPVTRPRRSSRNTYE